MKRIGILTMHRPINYGSALQAWATLQILEEMGYKPEIIDYIYPNRHHKKKSSTISKIKNIIIQGLLGSPWAKKTKKFEQFWHYNYKLSAQYPDRSSIIDNIPEYDIYLVGSDQVWNPKMIKGDSTFLLDFVPHGRPRISFSSSFAIDHIPESSQSLYIKNLSAFNGISVREKNGVKIVRDLLGMDCPVTLDPTLLLEPRQYEVLACQSNLKIQEPYMLVYILKYAFDPYPYATQIIEEAYRQLGLKVVYIDFSRSQKINIKNFTHLHDAISPQDFVSLFKNASMVITNSFHGAAFAINYNKSLYAIANPNNSDDRVSNLLSSVGLKNRIFRLGAKYPKFDVNPLPKEIREELNKLKIKSKEYLSTALASVANIPYKTTANG